MESFMRDLGALKIKIILAGGGLFTIIMLLFATLRGILNSPPGNEFEYLFPVLGALVIVAVSSIVFIALAFAPLVNSTYKWIRALEDWTQSALEEDWAVVTRMSDELQRNRETLEQTQREMEVARQSLAALQASSAGPQDAADTPAANESNESNLADRVTARVAEIVDKIQRELDDRAARIDTMYERLAEQQSQIEEHLQQMKVLRSHRAAGRSPKAPTKPMPQVRTQAGIRAMSLERVRSIRAQNKIPDFTVTCQVYNIDPKSVKEHARELFAKWNISSYRMVWQYDDERGVWETLGFSEEMEKLE
jgi:hypothetical protein